jgi:hypothetical protein
MAEENASHTVDVEVRALWSSDKDVVIFADDNFTFFD